MNLLRRIFQFKRMYLLILAPLGVLLTLLAKFFGGWVENVYARGIYPVLQRLIGGAVSWFSFSVSEIVIALAVLGALAYIVFCIIWICRDTKGWKHTLYRAGVNILCVASVIYFAFVITMGLNYYRVPAAQYLSLQVRSYSVEELKDTTAWLAEQASLERKNLPEDENGVFALEGDFSEIAAEAQSCFNKISDTYEDIGRTFARNKPMVFSPLMSRLLTMGVYFPITMESNINTQISDHTLPSTMCHELSHTRGYMREEEANFLSFLACMQSERADFRYSGYMLAFTYALSELAQVDEAAAIEVAQSVYSGVVRDDVSDQQYWDQFRETTLAQTGGEIYDAYLQSNNQPQGMKSYGEMLDLVIAWYLQEVK